MRKALLVILLLVVPAAAQAQGRGARGRRRYSREPTIASLASVLTGGHCLIDRLSLTADQKKVLLEAYKQWSAKRAKVGREVWAKLPKMSREDWRNAKKVAAWRAQRQKLMDEAGIKPPVEQVNDVLTPEQFGKIAEANKAVAEWETWLLAHVATYDAKLTAAIGPDVPEQTAPPRYAYRSLDTYEPMGAQLAGRLELTDEQHAALRELRRGYVTRYNQVRSTLHPLVQSGKMTREQVSNLQAVITATPTAEKAREEQRAAIGKLLTPQQRQEIQKGLLILEERNKAIRERYPKYAAALDKVLPVVAAAKKD